MDTTEEIANIQKMLDAQTELLAKLSAELAITHAKVHATMRLLVGLIESQGTSSEYLEDRIAEIVLTIGKERAEFLTSPLILPDTKADDGSIVSNEGKNG